MSGSPIVSNTYYETLGRFVNMFAYSEGMIYMFLCLLTGLSRAESAALFSGSKVDGICSLIKRLFEARKQPMPSELSDCLDHLAMINSFRNDILHWGIDPAGKVTNFVKAVPGREQEFMVSKDDLLFAISDLMKISELLAAFHAPLTSGEDETKRLQEIRSSSWQYKPAQRGNTRQQNRSTFQKPKRPQKPSRGK